LDTSGGFSTIKEKRSSYFLGQEAVIWPNCKLIQVFINLLSNALKFTPNGGNVEIKANESEKYIEVCVKDDGIGIPPDKIDKIFNKFYQIDNTSARPYGGSELGLAITKSIMDGHGGTVRVESTPGEGSVFTLTFLK
jgi:signal transduction histidine kinase